MEVWVPCEGCGFVSAYKSREATTSEGDGIHKGAQGHSADYGPVEGGVQVFEAAPEHADVRDISARFLQEGGLLTDGLNQGNFQERFNHSDREAGEPGTGANIHQSAGLEAEVGGEEERFPEMPADDLTRIPDRGEIDLSVPREKQVHVPTEESHLGWIESQAQGFQDRVEEKLKTFWIENV